MEEFDLKFIEDYLASNKENSRLEFRILRWLFIEHKKAVKDLEFKAYISAQDNLQK